MNHQNIEHSALEADIERLSKEIAEKRNLPEYKKLPEKELVRQMLQPIIRQDFSKTAQPAANQPETKTVEKNFLPDYLKDLPAETKLQVEQLVDSVFHQGIEKTVKEAQKAGPFLLDAFHDAIVDKLYDELKKRKLI